MCKAEVYSTSGFISKHWKMWTWRPKRHPHKNSIMKHFHVLEYIYICTGIKIIFKAFLPISIKKTLSAMPYYFSCKQHLNFEVQPMVAFHTDVNYLCWPLNKTQLLQISGLWVLIIIGGFRSMFSQSVFRHLLVVVVIMASVKPNHWCQGTSQKIGLPWSWFGSQPNQIET